ncbi:MAG: hypothetical protein OWT28_01375 [Firmicutes bacterium]|nr:hypothetical protein [Bacillota bacterium]
MRVGREVVHRLMVSGLLWGWIALVLWASQNVGYMGDTLPVIAYVAVLLFSQFIPNRVLRGTIITVLILVLLKWGYYPNSSWIDIPAFAVALGSDISHAIHSVLTGQVSLVSAGVRTLAFLGVVTFGTKLLEECMSRPIWLLVLLGVGEFTLADVAYAFAVRDTIEMVLFLLVGLALLALTNVPKMQAFSAQLSGRQILRFVALPTGLAAMMVLVGLIVPKPAGTWPKPLALWRDFERASSASEPYGVHDNSLGGPFEGSDNVMLRVFANAPSYYRGEALQTYTGTGWVSAPSRVVKERFGKTIPASIRAQVGPAAGVPERTIRERIEVVGKSYPVLFGGYQVTKVTMKGHGATYHLNLSTDTIKAGTIKPGTTYTVTTASPIPTTADLAAVRDGNLSYAFAADLQLPASLPERDRRLAEQITAGKVGTYAKVEAIIQYLQSHETYQTQGIPYLQPGQDFVDQFLFVTHKGYCDHFSSALAVLARAVGIPSRWVQGYVTVPADPHYHGKTHEYVLRGTDAHSWAEIWFAGYGWIPMEATPSFVLPMQQKTAAVHAQASAVHHPVGAKAKSARLAGANISPQSIGRWIASTAVWLIVALAVVALLFVAGVQGFRRWRERKVQHSAEQVRMDFVLGQLLRLFGRRSPDLTLREYAATLTSLPLQTRTELKGFVEWYEAWRYGGRLGVRGLDEGLEWLHLLARLGRRQKAKPQESAEVVPPSPFSASS